MARCFCPSAGLCDLVICTDTVALPQHVHKKFSAHMILDAAPLIKRFHLAATLSPLRVTSTVTYWCLIREWCGSGQCKNICVVDCKSVTIVAVEPVQVFNALACICKILPAALIISDHARDVRCRSRSSALALDFVGAAPRQHSCR
jgi:hypothetical protein